MELIPVYGINENQNELRAGGVLVAEAMKTGVGVLDKAMAILRVFPRGDVHFSPREISARTGFPVPTVYRLTRALEEHGLLEKEGERFKLGLALLHLGARVAGGIELRREVMPHLEWLSERTGENAELHIRREEARVPVELVRSSQNLRPFVEIGAPLPLHLGAAGKVLLAWLPEEEQVSLGAASAARFGDTEVFDKETLRERLKSVRMEGWAASDGERSPGVAAIAAPVFGAAGEVEGALLLSAPSVRLPARQRRKFVALVCEAAARASRDLGYDGGLSPSKREVTA
jgi:DNA-binding IclR family transcriptional regulator